MGTRQGWRTRSFAAREERVSPLPTANGDRRAIQTRRGGAQAVRSKAKGRNVGFGNATRAKWRHARSAPRRISVDRMTSPKQVGLSKLKSPSGSDRHRRAIYGSGRMERLSHARRRKGPPSTPAPRVAFIIRSIRTSDAPEGGIARVEAERPSSSAYGLEPPARAMAR